MIALEEPLAPRRAAHIDSAPAGDGGIADSSCESKYERVEARPWLDAGQSLSAEQAWAHLQLSLIHI